MNVQVEVEQEGICIKSVITSVATNCFFFFAFLNILILFNSFNAKFKAWNKDLKVQE